MSKYRVEVDVAPSRPRRTHKTIFSALESHSGDAAELLGCLWAYNHPLVVEWGGNVVTDWTDDVRVELA